MTTIYYANQPAGVSGAGYAFLLPAAVASAAAPFFTAMCRYALDVEYGLLEGPYDQDKAEAYARAGLIDPRLLDCRDDRWLARQLGVPVEQIALARADTTAP
jgi:hypothetical protein